MAYRNIFIILLLGIFAISCGTDPLDVDTSNVKINLSFVNVDSILFNANEKDLIASNNHFKTEINEVYSYNIGYCMQIGDLSDTAFVNSIYKFRADTFIVRLENEIEKKFRNIADMNASIIDGFKHLKYHFPKKDYPSHIVYMNSLFSSSIFCTKQEIGVGLDRYLGYDSEIVKNLNSMHFHEWIKHGMNRVFLERDVLTGWIETNLVEEVDGNLAEKIVRWGKIIYFTEAAFPELDKHIILRYSEEQLKWAYDNEFEFWDYIVGENMLFQLNERNEANMLGPGPKTPGLPKEGAPDRLGQFLGWQMVKSYMDQNDISLAELAELTYNEILQEYEVD